MSEEKVTLSVVLDAIKELTSAVGDLVDEQKGMREDMGLKKRAGVFDQTKLPKEK